MAILARSKFAGFLRGLVGRGESQEPARPVASAAPLPVPPAVPSAAGCPVPAPVAPAAGSDEIELPLASVLAGLPLDMQAKLMATPPAGQTISLPAEMVISQLAFGAVKISFGELRQLAPGAFVNTGGELDNKLVNLPLPEILPRLKPALFARRAGKKVEVADEITGPFAERGRGFTFTTQPLKAPTPPPPPAPEPEPPVFVSSLAPRQVSPPPAAPLILPHSITPVKPASGSNGNGHGHGHPLPISPLSPRSVTPAAGGSKGIPLTPGLRSAPTNGNGHFAPPPLRMSAVPAPTPLPATPRPEPAQPTIFVLLGDLCENWPEQLRNEILRSPLAQASVPLDGAMVLPGLKRGRVVMTWKQLRMLAQPSSTPSAIDTLELELPLKVIAPLFLAAQKNPARPQLKAPVSADIPDLFFGFPQASAEPVVPVARIAPVTPTAPVAPEVPVIPPLPKPPEPRVQDTNFYVWGDRGEAPVAEETLRRSEVPQTDFMNRLAHPKDVVARASALPGVAGAVVAMQDGLRVASQVPAELNADTLAAFLPQIYERVNQSTRELRMGALNNLNFTVGNVPWKIFRVNAVYFAAFGRAGEQLPSAHLAQLASELDRKKQP